MSRDLVWYWRIPALPAENHPVLGKVPKQLVEVTHRDDAKVEEASGPARRSFYTSRPTILAHILSRDTLVRRSITLAALAQGV